MALTIGSQPSSRRGLGAGVPVGAFVSAGLFTALWLFTGTRGIWGGLWGPVAFHGDEGHAVALERPVDRQRGLACGGGGSGGRDFEADEEACNGKSGTTETGEIL